MREPRIEPRLSRSLFIPLATIALAGFILRGGEALFIPLALAFLLSFVCGKVLRILEQRGLPTSLAVIVLSVCLFGTFFLSAWLVTSQLAKIASNLPAYQSHLQQKFSVVESNVGQFVERVRMTIPKSRTQRVGAPTLLPNPTTQQAVAAAAAAAAAIAPNGASTSSLQEFQDIAPSVVHYVGISIFVFVLAMFMAVYREELRDKLVRLSGERNVHLSSEIFDEAASKVGTYLWTQLIVNACFGLICGVMFYLIGLPFAIFWGTAVGLLRFIPYVGVFVGGAMPVLFALASADSWSIAVFTLLAIIVVDVLVAQLIEPLLIGKRVGLSPVAVLISAFVWTFLWGPAGLLLAIPLTAIIVVAGRYVPQLRAATILLSDEPALPPSFQLYHRVLSRPDLTVDPWFRNQLEKFGADSFIEQYFIPALALIARDRVQGVLSRQRFRYACDGLRSALANITGVSAPVTPSSATSEQRKVIVAPVSDEAEAVAAAAIAYLGQKSGRVWQAVERRLFPGELAPLLSETGAETIVLCVLTPQPARIARWESVLSERAPSVHLLVYRAYEKLDEDDRLALPSRRLADDVQELLDKVAAVLPRREPADPASVRQFA